jgi:hypothetical protein
MRTVGQFGAVLGSSPKLEAKRSSLKGRTVGQFGVTFGSLVEADLGGIGVTGNLLVGLFWVATMRTVGLISAIWRSFRVTICHQFGGSWVGLAC